jgi:hypothetical protein
VEEDDDLATADASSIVVRRLGSATQRTWLPDVENVVFDPMTSEYLTPLSRYAPRHVYPAALLPLPPMLPTQSVTVTITERPWARRRSMRELSFTADTKLTMTTVASSARMNAATDVQNRLPTLATSGPRSETTWWGSELATIVSHF